MVLHRLGIGADGKMVFRLCSCIDTAFVAAARIQLICHKIIKRKGLVGSSSIGGADTETAPLTVDVKV